MDPRDKEKALEKLLPSALRATFNPGGAECPEADLLAAYAERTLSAPEAARWEEHFSTCARCQEVLAVFARSEEAFAAERELQVAAAAGLHGDAAAAASRPASAQEVAPKPRRLLDWRWLVPAVAAAAAVAVWIAVRPVPPRSTGTEIARNVPVISPSSKPAQVTPSAPAPSSETAPPKKEAAFAARQQAGRAVRGRAAGGAGLAARDERKVSSRQVGGVVGTLSATPAPAARAEEGRAVAGIADRAQEVGRAAQNEPKQKPAQVQDKLAGVSGQVQSMNELAVTTGAAKKADGQKKTSSAAVSPARGAVLDKAHPESAPLMGFKQRALESRIVLVATQDRSVMWRVGAAGLIEHSSDGGATWQAQASNTETDLLAGSAPTEKICWVVGRAGTILRTIDGEHWEKIAPPVALDYIRVSASDALRAQIFALDGKRFLTADGGRTWESVPKE